MNSDIKSLNKKADFYSRFFENIKKEVGKIIVGQEEIVEKFLIALISDGHVLIEGVPGLAKTLLVKTLADCMDAGFVRLQFTPDLLPADIVGTKIFEQKEGIFKTVKGPIFTNFILADEINRAPPKVQSALLEAMQERQVTIQGDSFKLERPFLVLATQNPIESEGTYKLPEAQVDRFMFKVLISYPKKNEEIEILNRFSEKKSLNVKKVIDIKKIREIQDFNKQVYADEKIKNYVVEIVDATRYPNEYGLDFENYIEYGASPRASLWMVLGAKAHAILEGRGYVIPEDVKAVAHDVLRHRIILTYEAEAENIKEDYIIDRILEKIKVP